MTAWYIARKDLLLLVKDKRAVVLLLVLPLLFISIVGMTTGQFLTRDENNQRFKVAAVDRCETDLSRELLTRLEQHGELLVARMTSVEEGRSVLKRGEVSLLVTIGPEFQERADALRISDIVNSDRGPLAAGPASLDLSFESRPAALGLGRLLEGVLFSQVIKVVAPVAARKNPVTRSWLRDRSNDETDPDAQPLAASPAKTGAKSSSTAYLWIVPGFTVMFAFFLISVMARSFISERDNGTLKRLLLAPIGTGSVLIGKTVPYFLTSVAQCLLLFVCGRLLFGMSWGPEPVYLIPVILCTSLAATSLGLLLATLVQTDQQVSSYGTTLILVMSGLSGCFFPREMFPPLMKRISLFTPHGWALRAFDGVLTQSHVDAPQVLTCCAMLVAFAVLFITLGWWRFRAIS